MVWKVKKGHENLKLVGWSKKLGELSQKEIKNLDEKNRNNLYEQEIKPKKNVSSNKDD